MEKFGPQGVNVVGVAVEPMSDAVTKTISQSRAARFTNLLDADGKAFAQLGKDKLPRVYLVDPQGKILWFDIEYSLTTRRELNQALRAVVDATQRVNEAFWKRIQATDVAEYTEMQRSCFAN